ncbi:MAG: methionine gamma-lyase family protein [Oscillospiraceae bacterium]|nr:methionine gamma-lyase family protein [Oscillospiraceae bacterium]
MFEYNSDFWKLANEVECSCAEQFKTIDITFNKNQQKIISAFIKHKAGTQHLTGTTGYGYGDIGRELIDNIYAEIFETEAALVRHHFVSGTHAIAVCLFAILRPGDKLVCATGTPYDSLERILGKIKCGEGSLSDFNIKYTEVKWGKDTFNKQMLAQKCQNAKSVYIQRSRGYSARTSLDFKQTEEIIRLVKKANEAAIIIVDNCYCEFVQPIEYSSANLTVGSLIKNPGGGIAQTGGYIVGEKNLIDLCANRLTAPGLGGEVGCSLDQNREILMGLFMAPQAVANALKTAVFCAAFFKKLGFDVNPKPNEARADIVQSVSLKTKERLINFCAGVQAASPIDSFVKPEKWNMPGYKDEIIMACGGFTNGATIESSADAPIREPYTAFFQGGLNFPSGKLCVLEAAWRVIQTGIS